MNLIFRSLLLSALVAAPALRADQSTYATAGSSAAWLGLSVEPRSAAMGGAGIALAGGVQGLDLDPAKLSGLQGMQVSFLHDAWAADISHEVLHGGMPIAGGGLGLSLGYLNFGTIESYTVDPLTGPEAKSSVSPSAWSAELAYGRAIGPVNVGLGVKGLGEDLGGDGGTGFAADLGVLYALGETGFSFAGTARNLGTTLYSAPLPKAYALGSAWQHGLGDGQLSVALDWSVPEAALSQSSTALGLEYSYAKLLDVRAGYSLANQANLDGLTGLSFGLGAHLKNYGLDYAFVPLGGAGIANLMSLSAEF